MQIPHLPVLLSTIASTPRGWSNFDSAIHALVVMIVVACATALRLLHDLDVNTTGAIYAGALGYAAGRSGSGGRVRSEDLRRSTDGE